MLISLRGIKSTSFGCTQRNWKKNRALISVFRLNFCRSFCCTVAGNLANSVLSILSILSGIFKGSNYKASAIHPAWSPFRGLIEIVWQASLSFSHENLPSRANRSSVSRVWLFSGTSLSARQALLSYTSSIWNFKLNLVPPSLRIERVCNKLRGMCSQVNNNIIKGQCVVTSRYHWYQLWRLCSPMWTNQENNNVLLKLLSKRLV